MIKQQIYPTYFTCCEGGLWVKWPEYLGVDMNILNTKFEVGNIKINTILVHSLYFGDLFEIDPRSSMRWDSINGWTE